MLRNNKVSSKAGMIGQLAAIMDGNLSSMVSSRERKVDPASKDDNELTPPLRQT